MFSAVKDQKSFQILFRVLLHVKADNPGDGMICLHKEFSGFKILFLLFESTC